MSISQRIAANLALVALTLTAPVAVVLNAWEDCADRGGHLAFVSLASLHVYPVLGAPERFACVDDSGNLR